MWDQTPPAASGRGRGLQQKGPEVWPLETRLHARVKLGVPA